MNTVEKLFSESDGPGGFARAYAEYVARVIASLDSVALAAFIAELESARANGHTVFLAGNGGSAATAAHMVNDLTFGTRAPGAPPLRAMSLTDNIAAVTALANDTSFDRIMVDQLRQFYRAGDLLVVVSASGNSPNVVAAARWVREQGGKVIGLLGFSGGAVKPLCDIAVHVRTPAGEYGPVEDAHMVIDHLVTAWLMLTARTGSSTAVTKP